MPIPPGYLKRVLVVEDDEDVAECLTLLLSDLGYEVHTARNGQQGVDEALRLRPDVVIADLRLVALSGRGGAGPLALASGFDHYLLKPIGLDVLLNAIEPSPGKGG